MDVRRLELSLWQGNKFYGRTFVNLNDFERNDNWSILRDCPSNEFISLTINGTTALETISDLKGYQPDPKVLKETHNKYRWYRCFEDFRNVGHLTVKLFGANELKLNEKTGGGGGGATRANEILNPFCLVELVNARLRTETNYKTTTPKWNKILTFYVHDIMSVLELTVFHEDIPKRSTKFLGKVAIPLLTINNGKKEWYSLKDEQLLTPANDDNPQILLEMRLEWNCLRAIGRMFSAKETKFSSKDATDDEKVKNAKKQNPKELLKLAANILDFTNHIENLFTWQSPLRSLHVYFLWVFFCLYLKLELLPLMFVLLILVNRIKRMRQRDDCYGGDDDEETSAENPGTISDEADADDDSPFNEQQRLDTPIECLVASLASFSEKVVNLLNFTNPVLSLLMIIALMIGSFILQFVSLRVILLVLGTIKFISTILLKSQPPSHALLNFLSRVPDNAEAIQLQELPVPDENESCSQAIEAMGKSLKEKWRKSIMNPNRTQSESIMPDYDEDEWNELQERYLWYRFYENMGDVGQVQIKLFAAYGLQSSKAHRKPSPFCLIELVNVRYQSQTKPNTTAPNWNRLIKFDVKDITSNLIVTVYDEEEKFKIRFLGRVVIPLLRIVNGTRKWFMLKNRHLHGYAKGARAKILLEMNVIWNSIRAFGRVFKPKEENLIRQEMKMLIRNFKRVKAISQSVNSFLSYTHSLFEWKFKLRSLTALILWTLISLYAHLSLVPFLLLMILVKNALHHWQTNENYLLEKSSLDDDVIIDDEEEHKSTLRRKFVKLHEDSKAAQDSIGQIASLGESIKNTFNFSVPELSYYAMFVMFATTLILHFIPMRVILLLYGFKKFSKRLLRPHAINNTELLDFLSRVPDNVQLNQYRELPPLLNSRMGAWFKITANIRDFFHPN